jgi:D-alanine transaminase/branched-chain amino acid aminotransferase
MIVSCFINGEIGPPEKASIALNDLGVLRGYAIFDFCRTVYGIPFQLPHHLLRFRQSAQLMHLPLAYTDEQITNAIHQTLQASRLPNAGIRLLLTGGYSPDSMTVIEPNFIITVEHLAEVPAQLLETGIKLMSHEYLRETPEIKTTNYITALRLRHVQQEQGAYDILYHYQGNVLELTRSNFFIVKGNTIITAGSQILRGVTRKTIIELAKSTYKVEERELKCHELQQADEAFLTGTNKKIMPVVQIDNIVIGNGTPGRVTKDLYTTFLEFERSYQPEFKI